MHLPGVPHRSFRLPQHKSRYPHLLNVRSITRELGNDYHRWAIFTDGGTRVVDGKILDGWGVISRSPRGRIFVLFGPVITNEAHLAFSGARTHSNNTAEMTAMIEALSFLGPQGPLTPDEQSRIYYDSLHVAGVCLGTIQARTHVQLALACQQSMIRVQHRLRFTLQHVYGHSGNLGNECADHAAALGTFGLISSHNVASRWIRHNSDTSECFDVCHSIIETLERLQHDRTNTATLHQDRVKHWFISTCSVSSSLITCAVVMCFTCSQLFHFAFSGSLLYQQSMDRLSTSASTASTIDDYSERNMWNSQLELLYLVHVNGIVDSYLVDLDLAKIAFSCHFALDLLCYKEEVFVSTR